jgi:hypothetical protein
MRKREVELKAEVVDRWLKAAEVADAAEDKLMWRQAWRDGMPDWVADKHKWMEKVAQAKPQLVADAKAMAEAKDHCPQPYPARPRPKQSLTHENGL